MKAKIATRNNLDAGFYSMWRPHGSPSLDGVMVSPTLCWYIAQFSFLKAVAWAKLPWWYKWWNLFHLYSMNFHGAEMQVFHNHYTFQIQADLDRMLIYSCFHSDHVFIGSLSSNNIVACIIFSLSISCCIYRFCSEACIVLKLFDTCFMDEHTTHHHSFF